MSKKWISIVKVNIEGSHRAKQLELTLEFVPRIRMKCQNINLSVDILGVEYLQQKTEKSLIFKMADRARHS